MAEDRRDEPAKGGRLTRAEREAMAGHPALCVWLTGLPAAGKTTLARGVERELFARGLRTYVLDGDELRAGLNAGLGFSPADRHENLRRAGHAARLLVDAGVIAVCAFVSPAAADRAMIRELFEQDRFIEVWVSCPVSVCAERDPKGLYAKAARGEIANLTGVGAPYEAPDAPELVVDSSSRPGRAVEMLVQTITRALEGLGG
jgi:adenylylsulfate kinase